MKIASIIARLLVGTWFVFAMTDPLYRDQMGGEWGIRKRGPLWLSVYMSMESCLRVHMTTAAP